MSSATKTLNSFECVLNAFIMMNIESMQAVRKDDEMVCRFSSAKYLTGESYLEANGKKSATKDVMHSMDADSSSLFTGLVEEFISCCAQTSISADCSSYDEFCDAITADYDTAKIIYDVARFDIGGSKEALGYNVKDKHMTNYILKTVKSQFAKNKKAKSTYVNDVANEVLVFIRTIAKPLAANVLYSVSQTAVKINTLQLKAAITTCLEDNYCMLQWLTSKAMGISEKVKLPPKPKKAAVTEVTEDEVATKAVKRASKKQTKVDVDEDEEATTKSTKRRTAKKAVVVVPEEDDEDEDTEEVEEVDEEEKPKKVKSGRKVDADSEDEE